MLHTADGCIQIGARLPDPVSRVPALSPPPIDPRSVLGRVAALTWRQPTGVLVLCSALLLPCHAASTAPILTPEFCLAIPLK